MSRLADTQSYQVFLIKIQSFSRSRLSHMQVKRALPSKLVCTKPKKWPTKSIVLQLATTACHVLAPHPLISSLAIATEPYLQSTLLQVTYTAKPLTFEQRASFPGLPCFRSSVCIQYNTLKWKSICIMQNEAKQSGTMAKGRPGFPQISVLRPILAYKRQGSLQSHTGKCGFCFH